VADAAPSHPGVRFPPPLLFVVAFAAGLLLHARVRPAPVVRDGRSALLLAGGWLGVAAGVAILLWAFATFLRARTAIYPNQPASRLVAEGPYRWSRNPMYVSFTSVYVGGALLGNTLWPLATLPFALALLHALVIRREERYLDAAFGPAYAAYRASVPRWLGWPGGAGARGDDR
jgi:protein-S-isoprenylcysteine O-methyltransferase Ste14